MDKDEDMEKDRVFLKDIKKQFEFDEEVASVFDDMLERSVPFYKDVLSLVSTLVEKNTKEGDRVCDLGCSTASTLLEIFHKTSKRLELVGVDSSSAMIKRARKKTAAFGADIKLLQADFMQDNIPLSKVIIANYTLQFVRPRKREELVKKIYNSLEDDGIFIFNEKIIYEDKKLNKQMIDIYYDFKKQKGYSEYEIAKKREALENVLIPYSDEENISLAKSAGFKNVDIIFKWANFACFIAQK